MQQVNYGTVAGKVYDLLKDLDSSGRRRVLVAAQALFGDAENELDEQLAPEIKETSFSKKPSHGKSAAAFFYEKKPRNKGEELAVAARFLEISEDKQVYSKEDLERVFKSARRNFDTKKFIFDIRNARNSGYFNKGGSPGEYQLSYNGQNFVDALPDLERAMKAKKKTGAASRRKKGAK